MTDRHFELWRGLLVLAVIVLTIWLAPLYARGSMRVATWNVWDWRTDVAAISRLAAEVDADVWCLQEANGRELFVDVPQIQSGLSATINGVHITSVHLSVSGGSHYAAMQGFVASVPSGPAIIAGDFNETPEGRDTYGQAWNLLAMHALEEAGWVRVDTPRQPSGFDWTHGRGRIDQIWTTSDIEVLACGIPPDPWNPYLSDHAPVWADVVIPEPSICGLVLLGGVFLWVDRRWTL